MLLALAGVSKYRVGVPIKKAMYLNSAMKSETSRSFRKTPCLGRASHTSVVENVPIVAMQSRSFIGIPNVSTS